jgi:hypothetical protein
VAERLPGFGSIQRHRYRNERSIDEVARYLRELQQFGPIEAALVTLARTTAAALDRLEHTSDRSEHVVGTVARVHLQALEALRPNTTTAADTFDRLLDELTTAIRNPAST